MTNWKMTESVKQVGKRNGFWKKMEKKYFFFWEKNRKLLIKIFF